MDMETRNQETDTAMAAYWKKSIPHTRTGTGKNVINFNRTFNDVHNLTATAVQEYTHQEYEYTDATVQQISDAFSPTISFPTHLVRDSYLEVKRLWD